MEIGWLENKFSTQKDCKKNFEDVEKPVVAMKEKKFYFELINKFKIKTPISVINNKIQIIDSVTIIIIIIIVFFIIFVVIIHVMEFPAIY